MGSVVIVTATRLRRRKGRCPNQLSHEMTGTEAMPATARIQEVISSTKQVRGRLFSRLLARKSGVSLPRAKHLRETQVDDTVKRQIRQSHLWT